MVIALLPILAEPFYLPVYGERSIASKTSSSEKKIHLQLLLLRNCSELRRISHSTSLLLASRSRLSKKSFTKRQSKAKRSKFNGRKELSNEEDKLQNKNRKSPSSATIQFNKYLQKLIKSNVQAAEEALWQKIESRSSDYDTVSFNICLHGWSQKRSLFAAQKADKLLSELRRLKQTNTRLIPDAFSCASVLNAYAKSGGGKAAALRAEELFEELQYTCGNLDTDVCHNAVMDAWSVSGDSRAGERAEHWLRKLDISTRSLISYNSCIKAYGRSQAPKEAQRLLDEMQNLAKERPSLEPDKISISTCIDAWSKWTGNLTEAAFQAESLLRKMEHSFEVWNKTNALDLTTSRGSKQNSLSSKPPQPDVVTYTSCLTAFARSGVPDAPEKALELIKRMEHYSDEKPNTPFFNTFIHLLAKTKTYRMRGSTHSSPELVTEAILREMKKQYEQFHNDDARPDKITYTMIVTVYASHSETFAAAKRVEELLNELEGLYNHTLLEIHLPSCKTYGSVLSVWAKAASLTTMKGHFEEDFSPDALWQKAKDVLDRMEQLYTSTRNADLKPTTILYSQIFRILANGRDPLAAERGLELLKKMKELSRDTDYGEFVRLDSTIYAYLVVTFTKSGLENLAEAATTVLRDVEEAYRSGNDHLKPTSLLYSAVLQAYAKSGSQRLACEPLDRTKELYRNGKLYAKPTTLFYNACIDAYARCNGGREAAEQAEALLEELESRGRAGDPELSLTARSFNAAILAWKNSNAPDASERAEALLKKMTAIHKAGNKQCRPDRVTINSIIGVWAKKSPEEGAAARAKVFLDFLEELYESSGDPSIKPDRYSYNSVSVFALSLPVPIACYRPI